MELRMVLAYLFLWIRLYKTEQNPITSPSFSENSQKTFWWDQIEIPEGSKRELWSHRTRIYLLSLVTFHLHSKTRDTIKSHTSHLLTYILYHYRAAGFHFSASYRRSGLDGMWGCGNRDGLLCNLSPIDQVQLTTHPHKYIQKIWIALDMQMMCWVKPVGERWRSEKKQETHPFLLHLLHICQDLVLKKAIERRSETLCKTTNCSKIVPLKKSCSLTWVRSRLFLCRLSDAVSMFT